MQTNLTHLESRADIDKALAEKKVLILDRGTIGGQTVLTHSVANYPGVEEISGHGLAAIMKKQAKDFGCDIMSNTEIESFDLEGAIKSVTTDDGETFRTPAVILAMGGRPRDLGLASEEKYRGKGISYCATCDGDFFTGKEIVVVGGGNSALEEAVSLTRYASKVTIVHMLDRLQGHRHAIDEAVRHERIDIVMKSVVEEFLGRETLEGVRVRHLVTGETRVIPAAGAFIFIGYLPNTEQFREAVACNERGEILTNDSLATSVPGVFAAGDSREKRYRRITTAVADGTIAALGAAEHVESHAMETAKAG